MNLWSQFLELMNRGGPAMWVLLALNLASITILVERCWFWFRTNSSARLERLAKINRLLREGNAAGARLLAETDDSIYGRLALRLMEGRVTDASAMEAVEEQRLHLDRFMAFLSTVITGAPMIGLIGTVTGLMASFKFFAAQTASTDPRLVGHGLAEALINTAAGLVVAVIVLFPYNIFRAQVDKALGRFESLIAAAQQGAEHAANTPPAVASGSFSTSSVKPVP
jgi:biopolymer transport protein ExbB